jgi:hypothetical protein
MAQSYPKGPQAKAKVKKTIATPRPTRAPGRNSTSRFKGSIVRCDHCLLVQFRTSNDLCRRCHASLNDEEPEVVSVRPPPQMPANGNGQRQRPRPPRQIRMNAAATCQLVGAFGQIRSPGAQAGT